MKQRIEKITIERVEGNFDDCFKVIATTIEQAEKAIQMMSLTAPRSGQGYDKTDFKIEWADESKYEGRIDLQAGMAFKNENLVNHIKGSMSYRIDQKSIPTDARITQQEYDDFIEKYLTA